MTQSERRPFDPEEPRFGGWGRLFSERRRFESLLICVLATTSVLKGMHCPLPWAYTQMQLDYRFGFVRRGLAGATVGRLFGLQHFAHFCIFSFAVLAVAVGLVMALLVRSHVREVLATRVVFALLASSLVSGEQLMAGRQINAFPYTDLISHGVKGVLRRT